MENDLQAVRRKIKTLLDAANGDDNPMASDEAQSLLQQERRLNRIELNKLHPANRFRLMFGQPMLEE
jgi:hypothetical protein